MTKHSYDYDYFVIGGGSGGVRSARIASGHGAKVGLAEGRHLGGTCVNIGCVPKKLFSYASDYGPAMKDAEGYGWEAQNSTFDWQTLISNKNKEINRLNGIYENLLKNVGVKTYDGMASFKDEHTIVVNNEEITANKILIAVGGKPRKPSYEGAEHAIISDDAFYLKSLPDHVVIEGGGYISVEFAHIFHGLGTKVTIVHRKNRVLRNFDNDISDFLMSEMEKQGINLIFDVNITKIEDKNGQKTVFLDNNNEISCDLVLSAIGRVPNTDNLGLENTAVQTKDNGEIIITDHSETSVENIYAVGDVADRHLELTPVAIAAGHILADKLFFDGTPRQSCFENIPTAIFSNPPIGTVGLSEEAAKEKGFDIDTYKSDFKPLRHTLSGRDERTLMKLIIDKKTNKVIGAHMCGADSPEILQGIGIAIQCGATKVDFDRTIGIHPTAAEEFVTMR